MAPFSTKHRLVDDGIRPLAVNRSNLFNSSLRRSVFPQPTG